MTEYESAKVIRDALSARLDSASAVLNAYPKGHMGLTPDSVKATAQWKADYLACDVAFQSFRAFNAKFVKQFKREIQAERKARYTLAA